MQPDAPLTDDDLVPAKPTVLDRVRAVGAAAQASVPGLYAWGLTVAPPAFSRGGGWLARSVAVFGLVALGLGAALEPRLGPRARWVSVWGLVATSGIVWLLVPHALGPLRLDAPRGIAGMLGWALFAFASAAPALGRDPSKSGKIVEQAPMKPRTLLRRGDGAYVLGGAALAIALQAIGWRVTVPERALLVRLVSLAAGLGVLGAATSAALARHGRTVSASWRLRARRSLPWLVLLTLLGVAGAIWALRTPPAGM